MKVRVLAPSKSLQPSAKFVRKAAYYPSWAAWIARIYTQSPSLVCKHKFRLQNLAEKKQTSLFPSWNIIDEEKSFMTLTYEINAVKLFSSLLLKVRQCKLECLYLVSPYNLVQSLRERPHTTLVEQLELPESTHSPLPLCANISLGCKTWLERNSLADFHCGASLTKKKSFMTLTYEINVIKLFFHLLLMVRQCKLECLYLVSLIYTLVQCLQVKPETTLVEHLLLPKSTHNLLPLCTYIRLGYNTLLERNSLAYFH